jgi:putative ABC transport system ATP-binding protein
LYKIYPAFGSEIPVIKGVSLSIYPSDKLVLIGPSGSGKTTLVSMLTGHLAPSAGQVYWHQIPKQINRLSKHEVTKIRREFIGYITQENQIFPQLSVKENIFVSAKIAGMNIEGLKDQYTKLVEILGIKHLINKKSNHLSRGEAKRVNIAGALITKPKILIGDEPVADLDPVNAFNILNLFDVINEELGTAFILTTHDQFVAQRGNRILEIQDGVLFGAHQSSVDLWNLKKSRKIPIDSIGRIVIPEGILNELSNPSFLEIELQGKNILLKADFETGELFRSESIRECQNCTMKSNENLCPQCGYPTIVVGS